MQLQGVQMVVSLLTLYIFLPKSSLLTIISVIVEQGFQMERKSYIHLDGKIENNKYSLKVGGQVVDVGKGKWKV